jgi:hypothetical protein
MTRHLAQRIFKVLAVVAIVAAALITLYVVVALILVAIGVWGGA